MQPHENKAELQIRIARAVELRRQAIVVALARKLYRSLKEQALQLRSDSRGDGWIRIESLSQLRTTVGGRFQNLKQRWVAAGLPLREHRGDRSVKAELDREGWIELVGWMERQGWEASLATDEEDWLFSVRSLADR